MDRYEEALEKARAGKSLEEIFPELKESEDERIRKELIDFVNHYRHNTDLTVEQAKWCKKALSYLEKQKAEDRLDRMVPIYNDKESFESALEKAWKYYNECGSRTVDSFEDDYIECVFSKGFRKGFLYKEKQKEQKPAEWSEEDEDMRDTIIRDLKRLGGDIVNVRPAYKAEIDWLKSLRQDEAQIDKMLCSQVWWEEQGWIMIPPDATIEGIDSLLKQVRKKLQQEQPGLPGIEESGIPGKDYIPVEWVDACEKYGKWKIVKQEQPEVDFETEYAKFSNDPDALDYAFPIDLADYKDFARHFYNLGLNARKEENK